MVYGILLADFRRNITVKFLFAYAAIAANPKYLSFLARVRALRYKVEKHLSVSVLFLKH